MYLGFDFSVTMSPALSIAEWPVSYIFFKKCPPWENFSSKYYRVFRICTLFSSITVAPRWSQRLAYIQTPTQSLLHTHLRRVRGSNGVRPPAPNLIFIRLVLGIVRSELFQTFPESNIELENIEKLWIGLFQS